MSQRSELARLMDATVRNARGWHYQQIRPYPTHVSEAQAVRGAVTADCSAGYIILCQLAKTSDPSGNGFNGLGNTVSIFNHLPHVAHASDLDVGDAVVYGWGGSEHVSVVREAGVDPLLWSNGWEQAPEYVRLSTQKHYHSPTVTYCKIDAPPSKPPHPDVDPYWEWLRWNIGEGEFKGHKMEPDLRPHTAPTRISRAWWQRRERFLEARKRPGPGTSRPKPD